MRVLAIGSEVIIGGDIPARILGVAIYEVRVTYLVCWWNGRSREEQWLDELEVEKTETALSCNLVLG